MANFYAKLKQTIRDCDILFVEPLSYMKHFDGSQCKDKSATQKQLLLCTIIPSKSPVRLPMRTMKQEMGAIKDEPFEKDDLDLTGSPLKDTCKVELLDESYHQTIQPDTLWKDIEESYSHIPLADAQSILSEIACTYAGEVAPKCWAVCGKNDNDTMLLSLKLDGDKVRQGILKFCGTVAFEEHNLIDLQRKHLLNVPRYIHPIETLIDSYYLLSSSSNGVITLQVSREIAGILTQAAIDDKRTPPRLLLHQSVRIENYDSIAEMFWRQLVTLDRIKKSIVDYKESEDLSYLDRTVLGLGNDSMEGIKQEIYEALTEITTVRYQTDEEVSDNEMSTNIESVVLRAKTRESPELTDQLWSILKSCSSYRILKEVIEYIFTMAAQINVVNMPTNDNRLAHLIREVSKERIAIPRLNGSEPLELLLEIGLEKVSKDYEYIFAESKLCSGEALRPEKRSVENEVQLNVRKSLMNTVRMSEAANNAPRKTLMHMKNNQSPANEKPKSIGFQNSHFDMSAIEENLARLGSIHLTLEHLILIHTQLNLDYVYTTFLDDLRKPLIPFEVLQEMKVDERKIPVSNPKILAHIEKEVPERQRVVFQTSNHFKSYHNTHYYSIQPVFPPNVFECTKEGEAEERKKAYYVYQYLEIESL